MKYTQRCIREEINGENINVIWVKWRDTYTFRACQ